MRSNKVSAGMLVVASEWAKLFVHFKRDGSDESIVKLADDAPDALKDAIREAHGDMLPDDYKYAMCESAIHAISEESEGADLSDAGSEFSDAEPSVYNMARLRWVASHLSRANYVDDAASEFGAEDRDGTGLLFRLLGLGWMMEAREVFDSMAEAVGVEADTREAEAADAEADEEDDAE